MLSPFPLCPPPVVTFLVLFRSPFLLPYSLPHALLLASPAAYRPTPFSIDLSPALFLSLSVCAFCFLFLAMLSVSESRLVESSKRSALMPNPAVPFLLIIFNRPLVIAIVLRTLK